MGRNKIDVSDFSRSVARSIRRYMGDKQMSIRALARATGRSESYLRARIPISATNELTVGDVAAICDALNIGVNDLLTDVDDGQA